MSTMKTFAAALVAMFLFIGAFVVTSPAFAEETQWPVWVIGFDFENGKVVLEDEDGFIWTCPFGESDWAIREEYILLINGEYISVEE